MLHGPRKLIRPPISRVATITLFVARGCYHTAQKSCAGQDPHERVAAANTDRSKLRHATSEKVKSAIFLPLHRSHKLQLRNIKAGVDLRTAPGIAQTADPGIP